MNPGMALLWGEGQSPWVGQWGTGHCFDSSVWSETHGPCHAADYVRESLGTLVTTQPPPTVSEWCSLCVIVLVILRNFREKETSAGW